MDWDRFTQAVSGVASSVSSTVKQVGSVVSDQVYGTVASMSDFAARSPPPPPPPSDSFVDRMYDTIAAHKKVCAAMATVVTGTALYMVYSGNTTKRRRRRLACRAQDGGRHEVVLLAGSPSEPLVRLVAQDLNVRGFIVYILCTPGEDDLVAREKCSDIRPLVVPSYDAQAISQVANRFDEILSAPVASFSGATPHRLKLAAVVLIPDLFYPVGPVEALSPQVWNQTLNTKVLMPLNMLSGGFLNVVRRHQARIIFMMPSIMSSLEPAFHAAESLCAAAVDSLALTLSRELEPQGVPVIHLKLGSFDTGNRRVSERQIIKNMRADVLAWPEQVRHLYGNAYTGSAYLQTNRTRGSRLRVLHHALFDAITASTPRVVYAGRGSYAYELFARMVPERLLTWILAPGDNDLE
ncbi:hypothetical protein B9G98_00319 [Wickerhamiella sorbophila]|uniref:Uncharacterized protein n=1 Tax=Wickerhamiella sorbophila TaxID=45607 RepID=A0A2T0FCN7_9ASCO|nr:hypothetical protein B9G98_00319 [Wickerhamiella sorbophila]PRT52699.1 hypothetical protein B9G98_00319 [Wickerhamiella sorbophila]